MSVEEVGVQGYEYQYLVSLLIVLQDIEKHKEIYIEKQESEDAQIIFKENEQKKILDIQVKKRKNKIELDEFALWISHFEKRRINVNLISKMRDNKFHYVLLVTDNRCGDEVSKFIDTDSTNGTLNVKFKKNEIKSIKISIIKAFKGEKGLNNKRKLFLVNILNELSDTEFEEILKRYRVWENYKEIYVKEQIKNILNTKYYVPRSDLINTINNLIDVIKYGRDSKESITNKIYDVLKMYMGKRIFRLDKKSVSRDKINSYTNILDSKSILLLTGVPYCGKTHMAKEIAQYFQDKGYEIKLTKDLIGNDGAIQSLRHFVEDERLVILEDPFGQVEIKQNYLEIKAALDDLLNEIKANRKVIITTRKDILFKAMGSDNISDCSFQENYWIDLTLDDIDTALKIWKLYYSDKDESIIIFNNIKKWMMEKEAESFLQPGEIINLWHEVKEISDLKIMDIVKILDYARKDSKILSEKFFSKDDYFKKLVSALAIGTNTINSISIEELGYLLSDNEELPGINYDDNFSKGYTISGEKIEQNIHFPTYTDNYLLEEDYKNGIRYLNEHGYIDFNYDNNEINFTHPIYHHACKLVFYKYINDIFVNQNIFMIPKHGVGSLCKNIILNAMDVLEEIFIKDIRNKKSKETLKNILFMMLYSIYPAAQDSIILWFSKNLNVLSDKEQELFMRKAKYIIRIRKSDLLWNNGEPWFNPSEIISDLDDLFVQKNLISEEEIFNKITNPDEISTEEIWNMINSRDNISDKLIDIKLLNRGICTGEAFIRQRAMYFLFKDYMYADCNFKEYLKETEHPNVIFNLFRGSLESWFSYSIEDRKEILNYVKRGVSVGIVAIRVQEFVENFEDEYYNDDSIEWEKYNDNEKKQLWEVWYELIIELFNKFPLKYVGINQEHLYNVIMKSRKYVTDKNKIINIVSAWNNWLQNYKQNHILNDYGMAVSDYLITATQYNSDIRKNLIDNLLNVENTSLLTTHIATFIDNWKYISCDEKKCICNLLISERKDLRWLKAVALTRKIIPTDIQKTIFGRELLNEEVENIVEALRKDELLEYCLNVQYGYPQPLWFNGYHHGNNSLYNEIIVNILKKVEYAGEKFYYIALREFLDSLLYHKEKYFINGYNILEFILKNSTTRKSAFGRIIGDAVTKRQCNKTIWDLYLEFCPEEELEECYDKICENIESIEGNQYHYNSFFNKDIVFNKLYSRLKYDDVLLKFWNSLLKAKKIGINITENLDKCVNMTNLIYETFPPRLNFTGQLILTMMKDLGIENLDIIENVERNRKRLIDVGTNQRKKFDDEYELLDWIT